MERTGDQKQVLVMGANGHIGSVLVEQLAKRNQVKAISRKAAPKNLSPNVEWIQRDPFNWASLEKDFYGVDTVFNTIGKMTHRKEDEEALETNVKSFHSIVIACERYDIRLVHLSTVAVYGRQDPKFESGREVITENNPLNASSAYGQSKITAEQIIQDRLGDAGWTIIRPANLIGRQMEVFTKKILNYVQNPHLPFLLGTDSTFNYIDVNNLVELMILASDLPQARNQIFNAVDGQTTWADMISRHAQAVGRKTGVLTIPRIIPRVILDSPIGNLIERNNISKELLHTFASARVYDANKARKLGWQPRKTLQDTLLDISRSHA